MKNNHLNDLAVFVEVASCKGFRAAANNLQVAAGSVSEAIQRIENRLGIRLIERTTRKISLTDAGEKLLQRSLPALADLEHALKDLSEEQHNVSGTLRLSAPRSSSPFFLDELIAVFADLYPEVQIHMDYDDSKVDLVTSGVDAAIRSQSLVEKDTHAVQIGPKLTMALVASPNYLKHYGYPQQPSDLAVHQGVLFRFGAHNRFAPWSFIDDKHALYEISPQPRATVNDLMSLLNFAVSGMGIAYVYRKPAEPFIASGKLVSLFDESIAELPRYTINYLTKRHMPARLRAFIDLAKVQQY